MINNGIKFEVRVFRYILNLLSKINPGYTLQ
jgi:hypothetical protein